MATENGEGELSRLRTELADLRQSFNQFVRSQASLVGALRAAEESNQARHRLVLNAIGNLRPLLLAESSTTTERVIVTDAAPRGAKGEISGSFKVGDFNVQVDGKHEHVKALLWKFGRWLIVLLGMALTGGVGWLIGVLRRMGEHGR